METRVLYPALPELREAAKNEYEYYGSTLTTNAYLRVALLVAMALMALLALDHRSMAKKLAERKPFVVYVNPQTGRAEAAPENASVYHPHTEEMKYFLSFFTTRFFGRNHKTVLHDYLESLYFLDSQTAGAVNAADSKTMWMPKFLHSSDDDCDIVVNNVVLEETEGDTYRARVEFSRVYSNTNGIETKRENSAAVYQFRFLPSIPNALIPHNPLGLSISYFREDKAF
jgi:VirB8 protein